MSLLQIKSLSTKQIGPVNLEIQEGKCVALSGASGSGKTMLLRAIADLDSHEGGIYLDDVACKEILPTMWRQQVGLLSAESQWWGEVVAEHFIHGPVHENRQYLETLGFGQEVMDWKVTRLSSGERQRLALARVLENKPRVLLLDEPTANLDPASTRIVESLIKEFQEETGAAILWVSHHHDQIERIADQHYRMKDGQLMSVER